MALSTNKQKQFIHILKNKFELNDVEYRNFLIDNFDGIDSSIGLSEQQADFAIHLLQYTYNEDYKRGFDKALEMFGSLEDLFIKKIETKFERRATELELEMFNNMDKEEQQEFINRI